MILTAEITLYPFNQEVIPPVKRFIEKLNTFPGLQVKTNPTATIIVGEYDVVMDAVRDSVRWNYENHGKGVILAKFLPDYHALKSE